MSDVAGTLTLGGSSLSYEVTGEGDPIVLLPGYALDRRLWVE